MESKAFYKGIFKWLGDVFIRFDVGGVMAIITSILVLHYVDFQINNIPRFIITIVAAFAICQMLGLFFLWISKIIILLEITITGDMQHCGIQIFNGYDEDLTEVLVELKRITLVGSLADDRLENEKYFPLSNTGNDNNKIRAKKTADINICEIPLENESVVDFLMTERLRAIYVFDISRNSDGERTKSHVVDGAMYELVLVITGRINGTYIVPQYYCGTILKYVADFQGQRHSSVQWIIFKKLTNRMIKEESVRDRWRPDEEVIQTTQTTSDFHRLQKLHTQKQNFGIKERITIMKIKARKSSKKTTPKKEADLTKTDFFKALDKVIGVVKKKSSSKGKKKTSELDVKGYSPK